MGVCLHCGCGYRRDVPHARHRLDVVLVFIDPPRVRPVPRPWLDSLLADGFADVFEVGFDAPRFIANHQGGFRVSCPETHRSIVGPFNRALSDWRTGQRRQIACPSCGAEHDLAALEYAPPAAFGSYIVELRDVASAAVSDEAARDLAHRLGAFKVVFKRIG